MVIRGLSVNQISAFNNPSFTGAYGADFSFPPIQYNSNWQTPNMTTIGSTNNPYYENPFNVNNLNPLTMQNGGNYYENPLERSAMQNVGNYYNNTYAQNPLVTSASSVVPSFGNVDSYESEEKSNSGKGILTAVGVAGAIYLATAALTRGKNNGKWNWQLKNLFKNLDDAGNNAIRSQKDKWILNRNNLIKKQKEIINQRNNFLGTIQNEKIKEALANVKNAQKELNQVISNQSKNNREYYSNIAKAENKLNNANNKLNGIAMLQLKDKNLLSYEKIMKNFNGYSEKIKNERLKNFTNKTAIKQLLKDYNDAFTIDEKIEKLTNEINKIKNKKSERVQKLNEKLMELHKIKKGLKARYNLRTGPEVKKNQEITPGSPEAVELKIAREIKAYNASNPDLAIKLNRNSKNQYILS